MDSIGDNSVGTEEFSKDTKTVVFTVAGGSKLLAERIITAIESIAGTENREVKAVNVVITNNDYLQNLNRDFKRKDQPTDVLSFNLADVNENPIEGDIYISKDRADIQAKEGKEETETEILRLAVHGFLHLCGWTHDDDVSLRAIMDRGEKELRAVLLR